ncbi:MAG TPA: cytochrome C assembly protein, partial [Psychrobacter sp.]|nr:cytochrome C assembly protein [Psychrobacter sp.]
MRFFILQLAFLLAGMVYILVSIYIGWALIQDKPIHKGVSLGLLVIGM